MTNVDLPRAYEVIDDPEELRIAIRELARVRLWIDQLGDLAAETPGVEPEQVKAIRSTVVVVMRLSERAEARLRMLTTPAGNSGLGETAELCAGHHPAMSMTVDPLRGASCSSPS